MVSVLWQAMKSAVCYSFELDPQWWNMRLTNYVLPCSQTATENAHKTFTLCCKLPITYLYNSMHGETVDYGGTLFLSSETSIPIFHSIFLKHHGTSTLEGKANTPSNGNGHIIWSVIDWREGEWKAFMCSLETTLSFLFPCFSWHGQKKAWWLLPMGRRRPGDSSLSSDHHWSTRTTIPSVSGPSGVWSR